MKLVNRILATAAMAAALSACAAGGGSGTSSGPATAAARPAPVNLDPYPSTYRPFASVPTAIVGATVFDGEGGRIENGTVLLRDGKVEAVGAHIRTLPMEIEYVYYLKLAMGVTTMVNAADRGYVDGMREAKRSEANEIIAPRMYPLVSYGAGTSFTKPTTR